MGFSIAEGRKAKEHSRQKNGQQQRSDEKTWLRHASRSDWPEHGKD